MRKLVKTIICLVLVVISLPWLAKNYWRFDPRLTYEGEIFDPVLTEEYDAEARASEDYVHVITEDGLAVPLALGNNGVEHRQVHMMVDGQEVALKFENNHLVGYAPDIKNGAISSYVFYRDYGMMLDLFNEYCRQGELLKRT